MDFIPTLSALEAKAFNQFRQDWGQPPQAPRRQDWLAYHANLYPDNAVVAISNDKVIGYNMVHQWGSLGWIGPIFVAPEAQGQGLGRELVSWSLERLKQLSCKTIGLETWPFNLVNIGLYIKSGLMPHHLVAVLQKPVFSSEQSITGQLLSSVPQPEAYFDGLADLSSQIAPGLDYRPLMQTFLDLALGEVIVWGPTDKPDAAAVLRFESYTEAPAPPYASLEIIFVRPGKEERFDGYLQEIEAMTTEAGRSSLLISLSSYHTAGLRHLVVDLGYRLVKMRLRLYASLHNIPAHYVNYLSYSV